MYLTLIFAQQSGGYTGWVKEIRGVVAQGSTLEETKKELNRLLQYKLDRERRKADDRQGIHLTQETIELRLTA